MSIVQSGDSNFKVQWRPKTSFLLHDAEGVDFAAGGEVGAGGGAGGEEAVFAEGDGGQFYFVGTGSDFFEFEFDDVICCAAAHVQDASGYRAELAAVAFLPKVQQLILGSGISFETFDIEHDRASHAERRRGYDDGAVRACHRSIQVAFVETEC